MACLQLEQMGVDRIQVPLAVQYVDHNIIQLDHKNPDDHIFLQAFAARYGLHFSRPATGILHIYRVIPVDHPLPLGPDADKGTVDLASDLNVPPEACLVPATPDPAFATVTFAGTNLVYTLKGAYVGEDVAGYSWTDC